MLFDPPIISSGYTASQRYVGKIKMIGTYKMTLRLTGKHQDIFSTCYMSTQLSLSSLYTSKPSSQLGLSDRLVLDYIFVQQESVSSIFINIQPVFSMILSLSVLYLRPSSTCFYVLDFATYFGHVCFKICARNERWMSEDEGSRQCDHPRKREAHVVEV